MVSNVTLKGTVGKAFLETMFFLEIIQKAFWMEYEDVAKAGIGLMNADLQRTGKITLSASEKLIH